MNWKSLSYIKKGAIIGFLVALLLFVFFSDLGRGIRHPISSSFIHAGEKSQHYQECMNQKMEDYNQKYSEEYIKNNPTPVITQNDCFTKTGSFLNSIGQGINNFQNSYFSGTFMIFGYFGFIIWFGIFLLLGSLTGLIIEKIKSK